MRNLALALAIGIAAVVLVVVGCAPGAAGAEPASTPPAPSAEAVLLDGSSPLRCFLAFRTPVSVTGDEPAQAVMEPVGKSPKPMAEYQSALPPDDWMRPDFDDSGWARESGGVEMPPDSATGGSPAALHSATANSAIFVRARFLAADPAALGELRLSLRYVGGAVVYLNGVEVARGHLPAGKIEAGTPAGRYPDDLHCEPDGSYLEDPNKNRAGFDRRYRSLDDLVLPGKSVVKGVNVLAVRLVRAPINAKAIGARRAPRGGMRSVVGLWPYVGLTSLRLTSPAGQGPAVGGGASGGLEVWNPAHCETLDVGSRGIPCEPLRPVVVHTPRNGVFSGRLAIASDKAIKGLSVKLGELRPVKGGGPALPASAVQLRHSIPATQATTWTPEGRFDPVLDGVPEVVPVYSGSVSKQSGGAPGAPRRAVLPLWFTVRAPRDCAAGEYEAPVTISAEGAGPVKTSLRVVVHGWTMPDPKDFRQRNLIRLEQEQAAFTYGVPLWSDEHFRYMGRSLSLMAEINSRLVPINLTCGFYGGNRESMVRWVRKGGSDAAADPGAGAGGGKPGEFSHDFTILDRYLDLVQKELVEKHGGKPFPLSLNCWGELDRDGKKNGPAGQVSLLDPATGKVEKMDQPLLGTEESRAFWKPVIDEVMKRVEARGWKDVTAFGHNSYCYPVKPQIVDVALKLWPESVWNYTAHNGVLGGSWKGSDGAAMPVRFSSAVWTEGGLRPRGYASLAKPRTAICNMAGRTRHWDRSSLTIFRNLPEETVLRGHDGLSDFGADNFPAKDFRGRYVHQSTGRGTGGGNNASTRSMLAAGPDGPVPSERFEMLREGTELVEAAIFLERALAEKKVSGDLAARISRFLDQRSTGFVRDWCGQGGRYRERWPVMGQAESDVELLELAAQAAGAEQ